MKYIQLSLPAGILCSHRLFGPSFSTFAIQSGLLYLMTIWAILREITINVAHNNEQILLSFSRRGKKKKRVYI